MEVRPTHWVDSTPQDLETDPNEGLVQGAPEYGGAWFDLEQSIKLYTEVYEYRGIRGREIWPDRSTLMIPLQYYLLALQLSNAVSVAGGDPAGAQNL